MLFVQPHNKKMIIETRHKHQFRLVDMFRADDISDCFIITLKKQISDASWLWVPSRNLCQIQVKIISISESDDYALCNVLRKGKRINDMCSFPIYSMVSENHITLAQLNDLWYMPEFIPQQHYNLHEGVFHQVHSFRRKHICFKIELTSVKIILLLFCVVQYGSLDQQ